MEDLREEPELEECEEEDENAEDEVDEEADDEETRMNVDDTGAEVLVRPVRNPTLGRHSRCDAPVPMSHGKRMLETNFSVTGINEIRTNEIPTSVNNDDDSREDDLESSKSPTRPASLDLRGLNAMSTFGYKKRPESIYVERVKVKLLDHPMRE